MVIGLVMVVSPRPNDGGRCGLLVEWAEECRWATGEADPVTPFSTAGRVPVVSCRRFCQAQRWFWKARVTCGVTWRRASGTSGSLRTSCPV